MVVHNRGSQFEMNTLKISSDTKSLVRKPYVWEKPGSRLYDYHYEIGGLYYQPMIKYIVDKESTGARQQVDIPDRLLSNFDRRAYRLKDEELNLEDFLTGTYTRRTRNINQKMINVENEKIRRSKEQTKLNMMRGAACIRDKYLCQLQLFHTGRRAGARQEEEDLMGKKHVDDSYGPGFEKDVIYRKKRSPEVRLSQIFEDKFSLDHKGVENFRKSNEFKYLSGRVHDAQERSEAALEFSAKDDLEKDTGVDLKHQATYIGAMSTVKKIVHKAKKEVEGERIHPSDLTLTYSGVNLEDDCGPYERIRRKADRFKPKSLPEIEDGYEKAFFRCE